MQFLRVFQMWKVVESVDEELTELKLFYKEKSADFEKRWIAIKKGKDAMEKNKKKFQTFIRNEEDLRN